MPHRVSRGGFVIVVIGEILIDQFPDYERMGGAPFNFAYHLKKLGFPVRFFTRVGQDRHGRRICDKLSQAGFALTDVQIDPRHPTGTVRVDLDERGVPQFDIHENVAYDHLDLDRCRAVEADDTEMVYFGSLVQRTDSGYRQVRDLLSRRRSKVTGFCDINLRPPHVNTRAVAKSLHHADLLKLNEDELADIQRRFEGPASPADTVGWLMRAFGIHTVALTRGGRGSSVYSGQGAINCPGVYEVTIVDTVGAGDGYAAILATGLIRRQPWQMTVDQASRFAAKICGIPGAIPDDEAFYDDFQSSMRGIENE